MTESDVQQHIQLEGARLDCLLLRNNSGAAKDETGRVIRFGLGNVSAKHQETMRSSDLIGFTVVEVTPEMVGRRLAVFTAIEVKDPTWKLRPGDKRGQAQHNFINWVRLHGGIAGFANSLESLRRLLGR
jgi:hypothetical protein